MADSLLDRLDRAIARHGDATPAELKALKKIMTDGLRVVERIIRDNPTNWGMAHAEATRKRLATGLEDLHRRLGRAMATGLKTRVEAATDDMAELAGRYEREVARALEPLDRAYLALVQANGADRVTYVTDEIKKAVTQQVQSAILAELSPDDAMQRIAVGLQGQQGTWPSLELRTEAIYRTEVGRTYNAATAAKQAEWDRKSPGLLKVWRHSGGTINPRPHHVRTADRYSPGGRPGPIPVAEDFSLELASGGRMDCPYPQWPGLPAGEVVFCGCGSGPYREGWR